MKHHYIKEDDKIYEPKEIELVREVEMENTMKEFKHGTKQYNDKMKEVKHKYGKDTENKDALS